MACRVADPFRHLVDSVGTLFNPVGTVVDKLRVGIFRLKVLTKTQADIDSSTQTTTLQYLRVRPVQCSTIRRDCCIWHPANSPNKSLRCCSLCCLWACELLPKYRRTAKYCNSWA